MPNQKEAKNLIKGQKQEKNSLWRKPIALEIFEDDDPLTGLYRGREFGEQNSAAIAGDQTRQQQASEKAENDLIKKTTKISEKKVIVKNPEPLSVKETPDIMPAEDQQEEGNAELSLSPKLSVAELKSILKIKTDFFHFTDLREILRGKSFDIYAYLRFLSGDSGICKIKHLDLMRELDISRPTLFKQGGWLTRLSLIEKRTVPGDHLGTTYMVHRLEDILPVPDTLIVQLESHIKNLELPAE